MLVKILKGSKDKKVLEYKLDECPAYGYYHDLTMDEIGKRRYIPLLKAWQKGEVRKVREKIGKVIAQLETAGEDEE